MAVEKKTTGRILWLDIMRGFLMFLVVYAHITTNQAVNDYIYSFHMPAFFILSGMTFAFNKETRILAYLKKRLVGLVIPYFLLNLYVTPIWYWNLPFGFEASQSWQRLVIGILLSNKKTGFRMASNTTWFITCLFVADMMFFLIWRFCKKELRITIAAVAVTALAYVCGILRRPGGGIWHVETAFTAMIFILAGYLVMKHISGLDAVLKKAGKMCIPIIIGLLAVGYVLHRANGRITMVGDEYGNLLFFYTCVFATTAAIMFFFMAASGSGRFLKVMHPVNLVGKNTLPYIGFQVPLMRVMRHYIPFFMDQRDSHRLLLALCFYFGFLPLAILIQKYLLPGKYAIWHRRGKKENARGQI